MAQVVARYLGVVEAASSSLVTQTMQSVLIGSEYPVMDTLLFYFLKSSYRNLFRGVAECYAFSRFHDNVGLRDLPAIRHIESADAVVVDHDTLIGSCPLLSSPTGNDPAFPKLAFLAHSHAGGHGAPFGLAITESLLSEKAIHLSRNTVPPGSNCYRLRRGKDFPIWKPLNLQRTFFLENLVLSEKNF